MTAMSPGWYVVYEDTDTRLLPDYGEEALSFDDAKASALEYLDTLVDGCLAARERIAAGTIEDELEMATRARHMASLIKAKWKTNSAGGKIPSDRP
jgi:hypothetical protein